MFIPLLKGFSASGSLIMAIGAQNAFVIRQGLKHQYLLLTALICSVLDAILIVCGVAGFGHIISEYPLLIELTTYFAVVFLFLYGILSFYSAFKAKSMECSAEEREVDSARKTLLALLALTLLNPHVYLDTVILLGSIASQHPMHEKYFFAFGAVSASFVWFFSITYGARFLAPLFKKASAWKVIDCLTGLMMWGIAYNLLDFSS